MLDFKRDIEPYLELDASGKPKARLLHTFYQASIDHRDRLRTVFRKQYPDYLDINRPKEREAYKIYRKEIYRNPMRPLRRRVIEALDYIKQADDFDVTYPKISAEATDSFKAFVSDSTYTKDGNFVDWFFANIRKKYVDDPNAVFVVLPLTQPDSDTERVKPMPVLIKCECVYQFRKGEFAVLESPERTWIQTEKGPEKTGKILIFVDGDSYCVARQLAKKEANQETSLLWDITGAQYLANAENPEQFDFYFKAPAHNCPTMPARKIGKINEDEAEEKTAKKSTYTLVSSNDAGEEYFESILADALPHIEGTQEVGSDIQVERNFHVSGEEWRFAPKKCPDSAVGGAGECVDGYIPIKNASHEMIGKAKCPKCEGGYVTSGSGVGGLIIVSSPSANNPQDEGRPSNLPIPPGGFIPRNIDPIKVFIGEFDREKKAAYEVTNMQFLMESLNNQSGIAKALDREELYKTLIVHGKHICSLLQFGYECGAYQRNQASEIPTVLSPVRLSIENSEITRAELSEAVKNEFDANLRAPLEKKLIEYQSGKNSDYYRSYEIRERMDFYKNYNMESKLFLLSTARLTMDVQSPQYKALAERVWLSVNFDGLVADQLRKGEGFWDLKPDKQYERLLAGVREILADAKPVMIDPKTGLPTQTEGVLGPIADIKNNNQL
ncbi:hypothetical protein GCM10028808_73280 [Spirosoma migulaei]